MSYPEVESARAAARLLAVAVTLGMAGLAVSLAAVEAPAPAAGAALLAAGALGWLALSRAAARPRVLEAKISSFAGACGGRPARAERGAGSVYYCGYSGGVACYDPSLDMLYYIRGRVLGGVEAPERPDYRCTLRLSGEEAPGPGGALVFRGRLYAPDPGSPGRLSLIEGVEVVDYLACRDPAAALEAMARLAESWGAGGGAGP